MITVPSKIEELLKSDSVRKNFRVHFPDGEFPDITNRNIVDGSVQLSESLCSKSNLQFGSCEGSNIQFETVGIGNIVGCRIECYIDIYCDSNISGSVYKEDIDHYVYQIPYGLYFVETSEKQSDMTHRKVTAYTPNIDTSLDAIDPGYLGMLKSPWFREKDKVIINSDTLLKLFFPSLIDPEEHYGYDLFETSLNDLVVIPESGSTDTNPFISRNGFVYGYFDTNSMMSGVIDWSKLNKIQFSESISSYKVYGDIDAYRKELNNFIQQMKIDIPDADLSYENTQFLYPEIVYNTPKSFVRRTGTRKYGACLGSGSVGHPHLKYDTSKKQINISGYTSSYSWNAAFINNSTDSVAGNVISYFGGTQQDNFNQSAINNLYEDNKQSAIYGFPTHIEYEKKTLVNYSSYQQPIAFIFKTGSDDLLIFDEVDQSSSNNDTIELINQLDGETYYIEDDHLQSLVYNTYANTHFGVSRNGIDEYVYVENDPNNHIIQRTSGGRLVVFLTGTSPILLKSATSFNGNIYIIATKDGSYIWGKFSSIAIGQHSFETHPIPSEYNTDLSNTACCYYFHNKLFIFLSIGTDVIIYDITNNNWSKISSPFSDGARPCTYNDELYIIGGTSGSPLADRWYKFDETNTTWIDMYYEDVKYQLPYSFSNGAAIEFNNELYIIGSTSDNGVFRKNIRVFNPEKGWYSPYAVIFDGGRFIDRIHVTTINTFTGLDDSAPKIELKRSIKRTTSRKQSTYNTNRIETARSNISRDEYSINEEDINNLDFGSILTAYMEIIGTFGHFDRYGNFVALNINNHFDNLGNAGKLLPSQYTSLWYGDVVSKPIGRIQCFYRALITPEDSSIEPYEDDGFAYYDLVDSYNTRDYKIYDISNNYFIKNNIYEEEADVLLMLTSIGNAVNKVQFMPMKFDSIGLPQIEVGDVYTIDLPDGTSFKSLVMQRVLKGVHSLRDEIQANDDGSSDSTSSSNMSNGSGGKTSSSMVIGTGTVYSVNGKTGDVVLTADDIPGSGGGSATWGNIGGTLSNQTDLQNALNAKANVSQLPTYTYTSGTMNLTIT